MAGIATEDQPASRQVYTDNLKWAGQRLAKNDIVGVIEPLSIKPGYFLNSFTQGESSLYISQINCEVDRIELRKLHALENQVPTSLIGEFFPYSRGNHQRC